MARLESFADKRWSLMPLMLSVLVMAVLVLAVPGIAEEEGAGFRAIKPPAGFDAGEVDISGAVKGHFDVTGRVDFKFEDRIVIGDRNFPISSDASMVTVSEGSYVGLRLNDEGQVVSVKRLQSPQ